MLLGRHTPKKNWLEITEEIDKELDRFESGGGIH